MNRMRNAVVSVGAVLSMAVGAACAPPTELPEEELNRCEVERRTIETALAAWVASEGAGTYPALLEELVGVFLAPDTITFDWLYGSDGASYSMFGPC